MAPTRKSTSSRQRKLAFETQRPEDEVIVIDDDIEVDDVDRGSPNTHAASTHNRKRPASSATTTETASLSSPSKPSQTSASKRRQGTIDSSSFVSPKKKSKPSSSTAAAAVVTPADAASKGRSPPSSQAPSDYVPTYIHKNVEYRRQNDASLATVSPIQGKVLNWIRMQYEIPEDLEQSRSYGPLSGSSYNDRIIAAYSLGKLVRRRGQDNDNDDQHQGCMMCTACAELGHVRDKCPQLV